jgi:hypothetical protein
LHRPGAKGIFRDFPTIRLDHLSDAERRAYVIADNRLAELDTSKNLGETGVI